MSAEKLDTANGMKNSRKDCQGSADFRVEPDRGRRIEVPDDSRQIPNEVAPKRNLAGGQAREVLDEAHAARHALAKLLGKRDNDALGPADVG